VTEQTWILNAMALGFAAGLLAVGALADEYGRRRVFLAGAATLAIMLVLSAASVSAAMFVVARVGQGLGAAALLAGGLGLIGHAYPTGHARTRATAMWGASLGAGIAFSPVLTGALSDVPPLAWRMPYALVALLVVVLVVAGARWLPESRAERRRPIDVLGIVLFASGLATLMAAIVAGRGSWTSPVTISALVAAVALIGAFVLFERRHPAPLLDLTLFRSPDFVAVTVAAFTAGAGVISAMSILSLVAARGLGLSALPTALVLIVWSGLSVPSALLARLWNGSANAQLTTGLVIIATGLAGLTGLSTTDGFARLLPGLIVAGIGTGILNAALGRGAVASVPADRAAMGSGVNNTARFLGSGLGVTVIAALVPAPGAAGLLIGWNTGVVMCAAFSIFGALIALLCARA
jgi:MFS family permease